MSRSLRIVHQTEFINRLAVVLVLACLSAPAWAAGILIHDRPDVAPLRIVDHLVSATIRDQIALTTLNQTFENTSDQRLEGTYIFPIPEGADITDFKMTFNGKMVEGEVLPADQAREIYESIVRRRRDPGLIEFIGRRLLRARVFPIEPRSKTEIQISYQQVIDSVSGMSRYRYPLRTPGTDGYAYGTVRFAVDIDSRTPLRAVWSPSHNIETFRKDDHHVKVGFEKVGASLDEDFVLLYDTGDQDVGLSLVTTQSRDDQPGHFLLIISPKTLWDDDKSVPQDYVFVVDTSGSMAGEKLTQAQSALKYCINRLEKDDRFSIVRFSTGFDVLFDELQPLNDESRKQALEAIDKYKASGGTNIYSALEQAVSLYEPDDKSRPFVLIFLTDGLGDRSREEIEQMLAEKVGSFTGHVRIFPFGVGHDVNTKLLDSLSTNYGGMPTYVQPGENLEHRLGDFFAVFSEPVLTDVKLKLPNAGISDQFPPEPGDIYHGRQLIVAGQFDKDVTGRVVLEGKRGDEKVHYEFNDVSFKPTEDADYVSRIWAGRKIAYLLDRIRLHGESDEMVDEVVKLATEYGIQTPYTSWLVAPESERQFAGRGRLMPTDERRMLRMRRLGEGAPAGGKGGGGAMVMGEGAPIDMARDVAAEQPGGEFGFESGVVQGDVLSDVDAESGEEAVQLATRLAQMRGGAALEDSNRADQLAIMRKIAGKHYWNIRGVLVDSAFTDKTEILNVKFGSDAYFDIVMGRKDLRPVFAASRYVIVMADDDLAVVVRPETGVEELTDEQKERILN